MAKRNTGGAKKEGVVKVVWNGGEREYTEEVHGKDYAKLADEFVTKHSDKKARIVE